jgi:hypothetical protein
MDTIESPLTEYISPFLVYSLIPVPPTWNRTNSVCLCRSDSHMQLLTVYNLYFCLLQLLTVYIDAFGIVSSAMQGRGEIFTVSQFLSNSDFSTF